MQVFLIAFVGFAFGLRQLQDIKPFFGLFQATGREIIPDVGILQEIDPLIQGIAGDIIEISHFDQVMSVTAL